MIIRVTDSDDDGKIHVNINHIHFFHETKEGGTTCITFHGGALEVKETCEEIQEMIFEVLHENDI